MCHNILIYHVGIFYQSVLKLNVVYTNSSEDFNFLNDWSYSITTVLRNNAMFEIISSTHETQTLAVAKVLLVLVL